MSPPQPQRAPRRQGRRPGENRTREAIALAARKEFGERGFEAATLRTIARSADVDPALVLHFYGSKEELFFSTVRWPFATQDAVAAVVDGPRSRLGHRLAEFFLSIWNAAERREPMMAMLRAATTSDQAAQLLRESLHAHLFGPLSERLGVPDAPLRTSLCAAHLVGVGFARYIVGIEPLASAPTDAVAAAVAPALQRYLTGRLPAGGAG